MSFVVVLGAFKRNLVLVYSITVETLTMCMYKIIKTERNLMSNSVINY